MPELDDGDKEFIRRKALFEPMVASEAWKEFSKILEAQYQAHLKSLLSSADPSHDGLAQVMNSEYRKGAAFGIQVALATPHGTIAQAQEIIKSHHVAKEDPNAPRRSNLSDSERKLGIDESGELLPDTVRITDLGGDE
jgi:hypothetical protein